MLPLEDYVPQPKPPPWNRAREPFKWALILTFLSVSLLCGLEGIMDKPVDTKLHSHQSTVQVRQWKPGGRDIQFSARPVGINKAIFFRPDGTIGICKNAVDDFGKCDCR